MSSYWSHLNSRFGNIDSTPSKTNIEIAVNEMYNENHPELTEGDYEEHSSMWIDHGSDDGPNYTLYVRRKGNLLLEKRLDQDDLDPVEAFILSNVSQPECVKLLLELVDADIGKVLSRHWDKV